jgi:hypothetical protein
MHGAARFCRTDEASGAALPAANVKELAWPTRQT